MGIQVAVGPIELEGHLYRNVYELKNNREI